MTNNTALPYGAEKRLMGVSLAAKSPSHTAKIHIAGDYRQALEACRIWCEQGACVSVAKTVFVYTGGEETGVVVTLINYPRFPASPDELDGKALALAEHLILALHQLSASVETPRETFWLSRRDDKLTGDGRG